MSMFVSVCMHVLYSDVCVSVYRVCVSCGGGGGPRLLVPHVTYVCRPTVSVCLGHACGIVCVSVLGSVGACHCGYRI